MKYTTEQLEAIAAKLREMPPVEKKKREHNKAEAVRLLSKEIALMQKRGYTLDQISESLRGEGLDIATPTLKSYLQRAKPAKKSPAQAPGDTTPPAPPAVEKHLESKTKPKETEKSDTPPARPRAKKTVDADASKATFTPRPDSEDI